jgi:WD40 repeat protein
MMRIRSLISFLGIASSVALICIPDVNAKSTSCCIQEQSFTVKQEVNSFEYPLKKPTIVASRIPRVRFIRSLANLKGKIFISANGKFVADLWDKLYIYDLKSAQLLLSLPDRGNLPTATGGGTLGAVAISPDWSNMTLANLLGNAVVSSLQNGEKLQQISLNGVQNREAIAYSNKLKNILFVGSKGKIQVVDISAGKALGAIKYGNSEIKQVVLDSIKNRFLVISYLWDGIVVWDLSSEKRFEKPFLTISLPKERSGASSIAISPDGNLIAIGFSHETIRVYSTQSKRMLYELSPPSGKRGLRGDYSSVKVLRFSPDSRYLASGYYIAGFAVWDMSKGNLLQRIRIGQGMGTGSETVSQIEFSPDGKFLLTDGEFKINVWEFQD